MTPYDTPSHPSDHNSRAPSSPSAPSGPDGGNPSGTSDPHGGDATCPPGSSGGGLPGTSDPHSGDASHPSGSFAVASGGGRPDSGETFVPGGAIDDWDQPWHGTFAGLPVLSIEEAPPGPGPVAWLLREASDLDNASSSPLSAGLDALLARVGPSGVRAVVVPGYGASDAQELADRAADLPELRAVFLGAVPAELWEISWIRQGDITPLLEAYPKLERLDVRGSEGLRLRPVTHEHLRVLRFETGGLPGEVVRGVAESSFPGLRHLELWLGVAEYGGDHTVADLGPILSGERLPALRRLGLCDSPLQDELAAAVAGAPVVPRLEELSLSMGALTDTGAEALLSGQPLTHLRRLDLHHHFLTPGMADRVRLALPGVDVDLSEAQHEDDGWAYVAVSE
ncbi:STM4015 family protein [Nonomuraea pusilla]|uniref:STM4015 family protein n=1 Tax=Nonomuraea pusilla TaxID=46177 RepID=UPI0033262A2B